MSYTNKTKREYIVRRASRGFSPSTGTKRSLYIDAKGRYKFKFPIESDYGWKRPAFTMSEAEDVADSFDDCEIVSIGAIGIHDNTTSAKWRQALFNNLGI